MKNKNSSDGRVLTKNRPSFDLKKKLPLLAVDTTFEITGSWPQRGGGGGREEATITSHSAHRLPRNMVFANTFSGPKQNYGEEKRALAD